MGGIKRSIDGIHSCVYVCMYAAPSTDAPLQMLRGVDRCELEDQGLIDLERVLIAVCCGGEGGGGVGVRGDWGGVEEGGEGV